MFPATRAPSVRAEAGTSYELYYVKDAIGGEIDPEEKFVIHAGEVNT